MCLAIPGKVVSLEKRQALIQYPNEVRKAYLSDVTPQIGDYVMVQMGIIIKILTSEEAEFALNAWAKN